MFFRHPPGLLPRSASCSAGDQVLSSSSQSSVDLMSLVDRLHADLGSMVMFSGQELQLLAEFDPSELDESNCEYDLNFLRQIQQAADRHLAEKREIRDALGLLKIYNKSPRSRRSKTKKNS